MGYVGTKVGTKPWKVYDKDEADVINSAQSTLIADKANAVHSHPTTDITGLDTALTNAVPTGVITMWSGSVSSVPAGWYLCDGANGTPDLRDRFVFGASNDGEVNTTGGSKDAVAVAHTHTGSTNTTGAHTHSTNNKSYTGNAVTAGQGRDANGGSYIYTSSAGNHSHTLTINSSGESGTDKNLPPYMKLAYIMKG